MLNTEIKDGIKSFREKCVTLDAASLGVPSTQLLANTLQGL